VTETLELVPRQWKVVQHVREKFSCRACETIAQPPALSHPIARGRAGPGLLAHVLFSKYGLHLPLKRQSTVYAREGIDLDVSTLADWVGAAAATLMPLVAAIMVHVFATASVSESPGRSRKISAYVSLATNSGTRRQRLSCATIPATTN
jgi:transposase